MTAGKQLSRDVGSVLALVNSLTEILAAVRGDTDGLAIATLLCADAVLREIAVKLDEAETDAMALEKRLGI